MSEKILVSVDLISLFGSVKAIFEGRKVDYGKYLEKVENIGTIYRAYAYGAYISNEANKFITCLNTMGYETKYVKATFYEGKQNIKETDRTMDMVVDILRLTDRIDTIVLGTLNTNFIPFISFLKEKGIKVILYSCNSKKELRSVCDECWTIDESVLEESDFYEKEYEEEEAKR